MKLTIENIGKVKDAEIEINGLTIIAGKNATGKSTVSKSLFAMFNSFFKTNQMYTLHKEMAISNRLKRLDNFFDIFYLGEDRIDLSDFVSELSQAGSIEEIMNAFKVRGLETETNKMDLSKLAGEISKYNELTIRQVLEEETESCFKQEFYHNINNVNSQNENGIIELKIKEHTFKTVFNNNELIDFDAPISLDYEPIYIDDPFIVDTINQRKHLGVFASNNKINRTHREVLLKQYNKSESENPFDQAITKQELNSVYYKILKILNEDGIKVEYRYDNSQSENNILNINNLSSGMKTFWLLKKLLDNNTIEENSPVILDEPEVHLHPEWQLVLAEIIVLLQKHMSLNFLINTHSPYFLRAIEVYSVKHEVTPKTKYYFAEKDGLYSKITDVSENTSIIYKVLATPLQNIENERYL
ncbi:AAA family ATPase [Streptococcus uberis]|uniref:AAA family ATPase n=1 Tax=Streptococcus uberis TaxID=1349 RepID=UPI0027DE8662|nr:AAA family ATPase [Streptococcus uberis]MCK1235485.1 ATP-binding protein [Streptococcus uberis]